MFWKEEELNFTVPASMRPLMLEKLNTPSCSNLREKEVVVSNLPTYNGKYIYLARVFGISKPISLNRRLKKDRTGVVLQLFATSVTGAGGQEEALIDRDPSCSELTEGVCIQMIHILPIDRVVPGKGRNIKEATIGLGSTGIATTTVGVGDSLLIYGNAKLGIRYSSEGFPFRYKGEGGCLWYSMNKGAVISAAMEKECIEEMTTGAAALPKEELAIV